MKAGHACGQHEQLVAINQQGRPGNPGPRGPLGPAGTPGGAGWPGQLGPKGDPGPGATTFRYDSNLAGPTTFADGPLSIPVSCGTFNGNTSFLAQLVTARQTNVYAEGLFVNGAAVMPNLNSILVLPNSPTTIIGTGSTSGVQQLTEALLIDSGNASWLRRRNVRCSRS